MVLMHVRFAVLGIVVKKKGFILAQVLDHIVLRHGEFPLQPKSIKSSGGAKAKYAYKTKNHQDMMVF
jgi:hypothetical protein